MKINRKWGMPAHETFNCPPIRSFVDYYLRQSKISVDPFARNFDGCTYTNDLNPNTQAQYHMDVLDFLEMIYDKNIHPDLIVFDPPYSPRQIMECYNGIGLKMPYDRTLGWSKVFNLIINILPINGVFLQFGWSTSGLGMTRGFTIEQILLVAHGGSHNDTICMAERRTSEQLEMFPYNTALYSDRQGRAAEETEKIVSSLPTSELNRYPYLPYHAEMGCRGK